jgi:hypothetical protein
MGETVRRGKGSNENSDRILKTRSFNNDPKCPSVKNKNQ